MPNDTSSIRILVVEDNLVVQHYVRAALNTSPENHILAVIADGIEAINCASQLNPDVILLDLFLPSMDGIDVIRHVMANTPCPIVVLSGELDRKDQNLTFEAQRAGAVAVLPKPLGMQPEQFQTFSETLCHTIKLMAQVKVTRRWLVPVSSAIQPHQQPTVDKNTAWDLLVIGASTGGPAALYTLLETIAPTFHVPILIAQHITNGFSNTLCEWLGNTGCTIRIPENNELALPNTVYLAADDHHLVYGPNGRLFQVYNPASRFIPSVDMLFDSVADNCNGRVACLILTGMGNDGTVGMQHLFHKGATTIAEAESSCVVFGMPASAIAAGIVTHVEPLTAIGERLRAAICRTVSLN